MAGSEPTPSDLSGHLDRIEEAIRQLQAVALALLAVSSRPPVRLEVQHLEVHEIQFNIDAIDVNDLGGELNIGLTAMVKSEAGQSQEEAGQSGGKASARPADQPAGPVTSIWPEKGRGTHDQGEPDSDGNRAGADPGAGG